MNGKNRKVEILSQVFQVNHDYGMLIILEGFGTQGADGILFLEPEDAVALVGCPLSGGP